MEVNQSGFSFDDLLKPVEEAQYSQEAEEVVVEGNETERNRALEEAARDYLKSQNQPKPTSRAKPKPKTKTKPKEIKLNLEPNKDKKNTDEEKQKNILCLYRYQNSDRFGKYIKQQGFKFTNLEKKSLDELESLVNRVRYTVNNKSNGVTLDMMKNACLMVEKGVSIRSKGKLPLDGFSDALFSNEGFLDDLERFKLEYLSFATIDYRLRMGYTIISTALMVIGQNKKMGNIRGMPDRRDNILEDGDITEAELDALAN